jgi:cytochrome c-type biogenesis protein CcmE
MMASACLKRWALLGFLLVLMSCSSNSNGGGTGGTGSPVVAFGTITAFGSIVVNGIEFDIADATITLNGQSGTATDLQLGQVVTVRGTLAPGDAVGKADRVVFENNARGPIDSIDLDVSSLVVLGQTVRVDNRTQFGGTPSLSGLGVGNIVALSGFVDADGELRATRVDKTQDAFTPDIEIEATGTIADLNEVNQTFMLNRLRVDFSAAQLLNFTGGRLQNGQFVDVTSLQNVVDSVLRADRVEVKTVGIQGNTGEAVELQGIITRVISADTFVVNGQPVQITPDTVFERGTRDNIAENVAVEVEGVFAADGLIVVGEVELGAGIKLRGFITRVTSLTSFEVDDQPVQITPDTMFEGALADNLKPGILVEIEGFFRQEGVFTATEIGFLLQGLITRVTAADTFVVDGTTVQITLDTEFEGGMRTNLAADILIEVEGFFRQDGVFAAAEIEFLSPP